MSAQSPYGQKGRGRTRCSTGPRSLACPGNVRRWIALMRIPGLKNQFCWCHGRDVLSERLDRDSIIALRFLSKSLFRFSIWMGDRGVLLSLSCMMYDVADSMSRSSCVGSGIMGFRFLFNECCHSWIEVSPIGSPSSSFWSIFFSRKYGPNIGVWNLCH